MAGGQVTSTYFTTACSALLFLFSLAVASQEATAHNTALGTASGDGGVVSRRHGRARGRLPIDRLKPSEVTQAVFTQYMEEGRLLVVEGGALDWPAVHTWDLGWFVERFGDDAIQLRSADSGFAYDDRPALTLGEYQEWVKDKQGDRHYFSFVNNDEQVSKRTLQRYLRVPHYFPNSAHKFHPEWLYFGTKGSGISRHRDSMCEAKYTAHIQGIKHWVLSDGLHSGSQEYETTLHPGDLLLFYPQHWHQTETLTNASLSFNSYFEWDNTDNEFLRRVVRASDKSPTLRKLYHACYEGDHKTSQDLTPAMLKAMCKELLRPGKSPSAGVAHLQTLCAAEPDAAMAMIQGMKGAKKPPKWKFAADPRLEGVTAGDPPHVEHAEHAEL